MDVWIEFRNASKFQAEGLFRNFFPAAEESDGVDLPTPTLFSASSMSTSTPVPEGPKPVSTSTDTSPATDAPKSLKDTLPSLESASALGSTPLTAARLSELAKIFADSIPEEEFSVAELQGCGSSSHQSTERLSDSCTDLLKNKARPEEAAFQASKWVIKEREMRERLAREKEEKEEKERLARDKRRKEREERKAKEGREKEEKARKEKEEADEKSSKKVEVEEKVHQEKDEEVRCFSQRLLILAHNVPGESLRSCIGGEGNKSNGC